MSPTVSQSSAARQPAAASRPGADGHAGNSGFTLIELLIVIAVIGVIAALAVPSLLRARISANETTAIASMRAINSAQASYSANAGGGYATSLTTLGAACPGGTQSFISADLAFDPAVKAGYRLRVQPAAAAATGPTDCNATATRAGFYSTGVPVAPGVSGHRAFASNSGGAIFYDISGAAPSEAAPGRALVLRLSVSRAPASQP
jgi:prepilin-type N-terminal cleavage/methylation domain-containing protein